MCSPGLLSEKNNRSNTNGIAHSLNPHIQKCWVGCGLAHCEFSELAIPFELDRRFFYKNHVQPRALADPPFESDKTFFLMAPSVAQKLQTRL